MDDDIVYQPSNVGNQAYDGDQVTLKVAYTVEANEELMKYMDSKAQFVTLAGSNGRLAGAEAIQAIYNLTLVLKADKSKVTPSSQITFA